MYEIILCMILLIFAPEIRFNPFGGEGKRKQQED
jgi:hypothetical protein